jgi:hypothetical protein
MPGLSQVPSCHNRRALNQNGLLQFTRHVHLRKRDFINDVLGILELLAEIINRRKHAALYPQPGFYGKTRFSPKNLLVPF